MGGFIRTFTAIDPDKAGREKLLSFSERAKMAIRGYINWTKRENLHFTLKFLGEISPERLQEVIHLLNKLCTKYTPFRATISGTGFFPDIRKPRIFWAGLREGREEITRIAKEIETDCEYLGFEREKREFKSHITLARIRDPHIRIDHKMLETISKEEICSFNVDRIILYKSDLTQEGAVYSVMKEFYLRSACPI